MMSPLGIVLAGAGAAVGIVTGLGPIGAVVLGAAAWGGRVAAAVPRAPKPERIDPFTLNEPWRRFVQGALQAQARFNDAVHNAKAGPLRERLREIGERVETGVEECWRIANRGQELVDARRHLHVGEAQRELAELESQLAAEGRGTPDPSSPLAGTLMALRAQLASAERLDRTIADARDRLRLLDARLDEALARAVELSVQAGDVADLGGLGDDIDNLVDEMEALRQGLEEVGRSSATGAS